MAIDKIANRCGLRNTSLSQPTQETGSFEVSALSRFFGQLALPLQRTCSCDTRLFNVNTFFFMTHVPQEVWNQIAVEQPLQSQFAQSYFTMKPADIEDNLEFIQRKLFRFVNNVGIVLGYFHAMPLLVENEAIRKYLAYNKTKELEEALPPLASPGEAAVLMGKEYSLNPLEQETLKTLLELDPDILISGLR